MKRIISAVLALIMCASILVSCKDNSQEHQGLGGEDNKGNISENGNVVSLVGKDAAMILLAEQRLNEKLLKNEGDIFEKGEEVMRNLSERALKNLNASTPSGYTAKIVKPSVSKKNLAKTQIVQLEKDGSFGEEKQDIGKMEIIGDTVVWSDLKEVSNSYEYFLNLTNNIVIHAETAADMINFVKKNLRVVDKWIQMGQFKYYLHVGENEELMCCEDSYNKSLDVVRRYRNEDGKDVYEIYRDNGEGYTERTTYIAGERYELTIDERHFFVANNTKGYWENYVLGDEEEHFNISYLIMKDDLCYTFGYSPEFYKDSAAIALTILSSDRETDIFSIHGEGGYMSITMSLCAFDGILNVTAPKSEAGFGENNSYAYVTGSDKVKINTTNGKSILTSTTFKDGKLSINGINLMAYSYGYAGEIFLNIVGENFDDCVNIYKEFLREYGLTCRRDFDSVFAGIKRASEEIDSTVKYFSWNGANLSTTEGIREAINAEKARIEEMKGYYTALSDVEVIDGSDMNAMELNINFADISANVAHGGKLLEKVVSLDSLNLTIEDTTLFVKGEAYHVALALEDSGGGLIHLEQTAESKVEYTGGGSFTVTANNVKLNVPHLPEGQYRLVAYISTSDGIRSSKFAPVKIEATDGATYEMGDVDVTSEIVDSALILKYEKKIDVAVDIQSENKLSYSEFKTLAEEAAFKYGIPADSLIEMLNGEEYVNLNGEETEIQSGIYRLKYTVENGGTVSEGYVYINYSLKEATV